MIAAPWEELVALAERELAGARAGEWEEVSALGAERARRSAGLPAAPPPAARPALERLAALQPELVTLLATARAATLRELGRVDRGRTAVRGYGAAGAPAPSRLDGTA